MRIEIILPENPPIIICADEYVIDGDQYSFIINDDDGQKEVARFNMYTIVGFRTLPDET